MHGGLLLSRDDFIRQQLEQERVNLHQQSEDQRKRRHEIYELEKQALQIGKMDERKRQELRSQLVAKLRMENQANARVRQVLEVQNREAERIHDDQNEDLRRRMVERSKEEERIKKLLIEDLAKQNLAMSLQAKQRLFEQDYEDRRQWMNAHHQPDPFGSNSVQHIKKILDRSQTKFKISDAYLDGRKQFERDLLTDRIEEERSYHKSVQKSVGIP